MRLTLRAGAKINLGLRILGAREDGYHDISSVFQEVSLCDVLDISAVPGKGRIDLECSGSLPKGRGNLAWRAARIFLDITEEDIDVSIRLKKHIPVRAGLGGGSSDAACVLRGLSMLTGRGKPELPGAAAELGSDVPFFITGGSARVQGRGERVKKIPTVPFHAVLIHPPVQVSTPRAYSLWDGTADTYLTNSNMMKHDSASSAVWHEGKPFPHDLRNDFLPLLEKHIPEIADVARYMRDSRHGSWGLSGSGPTFYALFRGEDEACDFSAKLQWKYSVCRTADTAGASSNG